MRPLRGWRGTVWQIGAIVLGIALATLSTRALAAESRVPAWLRAVSSSNPAVETEGSGAVILLSECTTEIAATGRRTTRLRCAIRVLNRDGRRYAVASVEYLARSDRINLFNAWLVDASGEVRAFGQRDAVDVATAADALYSETRSMVINATARADAGCVFAWEVEQEELSLIGQDSWAFQGPLPVGVSRMTVRVPKGWSVEGQVKNAAPLQPTVRETAYTWEARDLAGIHDEPYAAGAAQRAARLLYDVRPPAGKHTRTPLRFFSRWSDVVTYANELHDRMAQPDEAVRARAGQLCATAGTRWDRIKVLGEFARGLRYVSVAMNLARGGGYVPHAPTEVLRCGYGDCKDKATLLRALLAAEGIAAYPVLCLSGESGSVFSEWPSPVQFNHVLVAIEVDETVDSPFVVEDGGASRLLLFDPTDPHVPVGDFPFYNQGGWVLVCRPGANALTRVPVAPSRFNRLERTLTAVVHASGSAEVAIEDRGHGVPGVVMRSARATSANWNDDVKARVRRMSAGADLDDVSWQDELDGGGAFSLRVAFTAPRFARSMRGKLLVVASVPEGRGMVPALPDETRTAPIILPSMSDEDVATFRLPPGYRVSDAVSPLRIESDFGTYEATCTTEEDRVVVRRSLVIEGATVPAARYGELREVFNTIRKSEAATIVLEATD